MDTLLPCNSKKQRIPRNQGRIEFISCKERIKELLVAGYDFKKIHTDLVRENKITMSYQMFCLYARKLPENTNNISKKTNNSSQIQTQIFDNAKNIREGPIITSANKKKAFQNPRNVQDD